MRFGVLIFFVQIKIFFNQKKESIMGAQCLAKSEMTLPQDRQQIELVNLAEPVRYGEQSSINSIITIRWLSIFFCLAFWYGVYKLVNYVFLSSWIKGSDQNILITGRSSSGSYFSLKSLTFCKKVKLRNWAVLV